MNKTTRRNFFGYAGKLALGGVLFPQIVPSRLLGRTMGVAPSGQINMAIIGNGLMGSSHRRFFASNQATRVLAVCDVDAKKREIASAEVDQITRSRKDIGFKKCDVYNDYEEVLDRDDIDGVCIATPDHWHVAIALYAIQKGKAVYVQKPLTLTIEEGRILSNAVKKYNVALQVGSQQRGDPTFVKAAQLVRNGYIGNVKRVNTMIWDFPPEPKDLKEEPIPDGFDYDKWLGSTEWAPYNHKRVEGNFGGGWRCFFNYGDRKEGDWGAHHFDIIQYALGMDNSGPTDFYPENYDGIKYRHYTYKNGPTVYVNSPVKNKHMIQFIGDEGEIFVSRDGRIDASNPKILHMPPKEGDTVLYKPGGQGGNFIDAVLYGRDLIAPAEIGHRTSTICHLSAAALRLKKHIQWDPKTETILNCPEAIPIAYSRPRRAPYFLGV